VPEEKGPYTAITQNDVEGGIVLATHLLKKQTEHILILDTKLNWYPLIQRQKGLSTVFKKEDDITVDVVKTKSENFDDIKAVLENYFGDHPYPDVIIGLTDLLAFAAMKVCQDRGLKIPKDIRIAGFNGLFIGEYLSPRLTTIQSVPEQIAEKAAELSVKSLDPNFKGEKIILPVTLIEGETT
ncbi:MAG: substrate-binding domain-containing protein, partial [Pseudomonadota bacterium]